MLWILLISLSFADPQNSPPVSNQSVSDNEGRVIGTQSCVSQHGVRRCNIRFPFIDQLACEQSLKPVEKGYRERGFTVHNVRCVKQGEIVG